MNKAVSGADSGQFWPNLLARNPNYRGRLIEIYRGYANVDPANFEIYFRGVILNFTCEPGGATIKAKDLLWKLGENKIPAKTNEAKLDVAYSGGTYIQLRETVVADPVSEFPDATADNPACVKIDWEYVTYTGKNAALNRLTGCTPGSYGTTPKTHEAGTKLAPVVVYGNSSYTAGLSPDFIFMDLLTRYGLVPPAFIQTVDSGTDLGAAVLVGDTTITLISSAGFPTTGCVKIDSEWIWYSGVSGNDLTGCKRGQFMTTAAGHLINADVYFSKFTSELQFWIQGFLYKARFEKQAQVKDAVNALREATLCDIWQNEDGLITCKHQSPPLGGATIKNFTKRELVYKTRNRDDREELRITRLYFFYNPADPDPGTEETKYTNLLVWAGADEESENYFNESISRTFFNFWIYRSNEATWFAGRFFMRYRLGSPLLKFRLELREDDSIVGDYFWITVPEVVSADGTMKSRIYQVVMKKQRGLSELEIEAVDTGFGNSRYGLISPAAMGDYGGATDAEKNTYCWIGDSLNQVGAANEDGYYVY